MRKRRDLLASVAEKIDSTIDNLIGTPAATFSPTRATRGTPCSIPRRSNSYLRFFGSHELGCTQRSGSFGWNAGCRHCGCSCRGSICHFERQYRPRSKQYPSQGFFLLREHDCFFRCVYRCRRGETVEGNPGGTRRSCADVLDVYLFLSESERFHHASWNSGSPAGCNSGSCSWD